MTLNEALIPSALATPLLAAAGVCIFGRRPDVRETLNLIAAVALIVFCCVIALRAGGEARPSIVLLRPMAGVTIAFGAEPFGALFALASSCLWAIHSLFTAGYLRATTEPVQTSVHACAALVILGAAGVALAGNLLTLFIFGWVMSLASYGLLVCQGEDAARASGSLYLIVQLGASIALFVPGMIGVFEVAGSTDFVAGGLLAHRLAPGPAGLLLTLLALGTATAAIVPAPTWMIAPLAAPGPLGAIQASVVVGAGAFTLIKLNVYTFGSELLAAAPATTWLRRLAATCIVVAAVRAQTTSDLRTRLAWLAVMQTGCLSACALLSSDGAVAAMTALVNQMAAILTLFMGAAAMEMDVGSGGGDKVVGRRATLAAFAVACCSLIGFAPFGGMWSRWLLLAAARDAGQDLIFWVIVIASLAAVISLVPILGRWAAPTKAVQPSVLRPILHGPMRFAVVALGAAAVVCVLLVGLDDPLWKFVVPAVGSQR